MEKQRAGMKRAISNILYGLRLMWGICRGIVIHTALMSAIEYFGWIFYDLFFIRYLIGTLENHESFSYIMRFILISGLVFFIIFAYASYVEGTFRPVAGVTLYRKLYGMLYKKAGNVELRCFEDSSFYNRYALAVDKADENLSMIVQNLFGILFGGIAAVTVFYTMYTIDSISVLFVFFPIIGNFVFGYIYNKMMFKRDQELVRYKRRIEYVNRVMHLADFSKEIRLSNVYNLMKYKYLKAMEGIFDTVEKYVLKINLPLWFRNYFTFTMIFEGVLLYGAYRTIVSKSMNLSELAVLSTAMVSAAWILIGFTDQILQSVKLGIFMENIRSFLEYEPKLPENYDGIITDKEIESIEFRNVSFAFISHRLSSVRSADMILMLENGQIIERGTHRELMELNGAYADMYSKQAKNYLAVENLREVSAV